MNSLRSYVVLLLFFTTVLLSFSPGLGENPPGCNGYYKNKSGNITSPGYPLAYPDEAECSYIVGVQSLSIIAITFNDVQFESGLDCLFYGIGRIVDTTKYEGKLTGRDIPEAIEVQTDSGMWFHLMTDEGVGYRGFSLSWKIQDYCGNTSAEGTGTFTSPNFPDLYLNNLNCLYTIQLNQTSRIQIKSETFSLEPQQDFLQYGIETDEGIISQIGLFTGNHSGEASLDVEVNARTLWFRFTTDYAVQHVGFNISWDVFGVPSTTPTALPPCDGASRPDSEQQILQNNLVLKIVVGTVIGVVAIILLVAVGLAYFKRRRKQNYSPSLPPTAVSVSHREPPTAVTMDELSHNEANEPNKTGNSSNHGNTMSTNDNDKVVDETQTHDKQQVNGQSHAHDENEALSQPTNIDIVVTAH